RQVLLDFSLGQPILRGRLETPSLRRQNELEEIVEDVGVQLHDELVAALICKAHAEPVFIPVKADLGTLRMKEMPHAFTSNSARTICATRSSSMRSSFWAAALMRLSVAIRL